MRADTLEPEAQPRLLRKSRPPCDIAESARQGGRQGKINRMTPDAARNGDAPHLDSTRLLDPWSDGEAVEELTPFVYGRLPRIAVLSIGAGRTKSGTRSCHLI